MNNTNYNMTEYRTKITDKTALYIIFAFMLLSSPFSFSYLILTNPILRVIVLCILIILMYSRVRRMTTNQSLALLFLLFFFILQYIVHNDIIANYIFDSLSILGGIALFSILTQLDMLKLALSKYIKFSVFVSITIILSYICSKQFSSFFVRMELLDYPVMFNPLLGFVNEGISNRPSWYFWEPSYAGGFISLSVVLSFFHIFKSQKSRNAYLFLMLLTLGAIGSFSSIISLIGSFLLFFSLRGIKSDKLKIFITLGIFAIVSVVLIEVLDEYIYNEKLLKYTLSAASRTNRLQNGLEILQNMKLEDFIYGMGDGYQGLVYGEGQSIAWLRILIEDGFLVFLLYSIFIYKCSKESYLFFCFVIFELIAVTMHFTPLFFFIILLAKNMAHCFKLRNYYNDKYNNTCI